MKTINVSISLINVNIKSPGALSNTVRVNSEFYNIIDSVSLKIKKF